MSAEAVIVDFWGGSPNVGLLADWMERTGVTVRRQLQRTPPNFCSCGCIAVDVAAQLYTAWRLQLTQSELERATSTARTSQTKKLGNIKETNNTWLWTSEVRDLLRLRLMMTESAINANFYFKSYFDFVNGALFKQACLLVGTSRTLYFVLNTATSNERGEHWFVVAVNFTCPPPSVN
ncbi:hypothetical protein RvY_14104 [Ramazzottius varieornatus]|uniref:Uncharacterized protein n=1 Tax=Ramazzottius varieornatus TaxID=947166 RepID=A0A1D1VQ67_RAMVA|nr:hypothetical protein RvY_14104 [Ramazzottius varieornatus]